jgi:dTDP-4-dehydrorhamnose reductase
MKILVTGSNGLLGQKIIYGLLKINAGQHPLGECQWPTAKGLTIIATSKGENRLIEKQGYLYEQLDISDKTQVETLFQKHLPDIVINTAAMTNVDACETQKKECWDANVTAIQNIVDTLERLKHSHPPSNITHPSPSVLNGVHESGVYTPPGGGLQHPTSNINHLEFPQLIHISTDFIFDGENGPYTEEDTPNPLSYYALSKWEGEKIVQSSKLKWAILRTIIVYGIVDHMSRSNVVLWAKEALTKGQKINVVDDQFRSPTLSEDLAQGCILAALKGASGIFNVSGKDTMSILELVYRVAGFWNLDKSLVSPIKTASLNQAAKRPPRTGFILDKATKELGYVPHSFEEGLAILDQQLKTKQ